MAKTVRSKTAPYARTSVAGAAVGFLLIAGAIAFNTHHYLTFFSLGGLMIVVGGVLAVAFMSFQAEDVQSALNAIGMMFREPQTRHDNLHHDIMHIMAWAKLVKEKGMRGLEDVMHKNGVDDPFVKYGLNMVISQYSPEDVRSMMETAAEAYYERDSIPADVLQSMAGHAPAFGMVGTLLGMVTMLYGLSGDDMSGIGQNLAVAFLSTLYGVVTARMIYMPAATKLQQKVDNLRFRNHLITEGMVLLVSNKAPTYIQDRLNSFLSPKIYDPMAPVPYKPLPHQLKAVRA